MIKVTKQMALEYHENDKPGKIEITPTKPYASQFDLSLAYSPGVAYPCEEIEHTPSDVFKYTNKGNLIAVISNGTAVLGLGNIGALASKPVMEGKALLFKIFAGLDCFDIEIDEKDPKKFIEIVKTLQPTFGGINLEDIKAPECFEIEDALKRECNIPVMHDDQHGTAIISAAGLINALEIQRKDINDIRLVVNGAGAAAIACTKLYIALGVNPQNIIMCDSKGVIRSDRDDLNSQKRMFATNIDVFTLEEAMIGADVFLGLSKKDVLTQKMIKSMADNPIVFALANPDPEISYDAAMSSRNDLIFATGRSDYPNQINNVLGFPYIFRGALDCGATTINEEMKLAAVRAIADLAKLPIPPIVDRAYGMNNISFGPEYILPKPLDPRLLLVVSPAVAKAAADSGVAKRPITNWESYEAKLQIIMGQDSKMMRRISDLAKTNIKKVVIGEGNTDNMLRAAVKLNQDKICVPILLGNEEMIAKRAKRLGIDISSIEIINPRHDREANRRDTYAKSLALKRGREGVTYNEALEKMFNRNYFGMMMVENGDADAFIAGIYSSGNISANIAKEVVGIRDGYNHFATMHILNTKRGTFFLADTSVNAVSDKSTLIDIVRLAHEKVCFFTQQPVIAMLSYSNFGSNNSDDAPMRTSDAVKELHNYYPEILVDGEMQVSYALDKKLRDETFPFNKLYNRNVNTLIFPNLSAANTAYKMMLEFGLANAIGPIQIGLNKPIHFISVNASEREIVNLATIAALDANEHFCKSQDI